MNPTGICHLCGEEAKLSFEHVPPKRAFNNRMVYFKAVDELIGNGLSPFSEDGRRKRSPKGVGRYTLCEQCNNLTGAWYAEDYVDFAMTVMTEYGSFAKTQEIRFVVKLKPLNVFKQILTMFCSVMGDKSASNAPWVRRYLLNKESREFAGDQRIFAGQFDTSGSSSMVRIAGLTGIASLETSGMRTFSEISYPPFSFLMNFGPFRGAMSDITFFKNYDYDQSAEIYLVLPPVSINTPLPGDFRTRKEVSEQIKRAGDGRNGDGEGEAIASR